MNNTQQTIRVGFFTILGLALIWVTFETLSGGSLFKEQGYRIVASFDDLKSLKVSDEVRMAGVRIGTVEETRLQGRRAEAIIRIEEPNMVIAEDAVAAITMAGLLGSNYIRIEPGASATPLRPDAEIRTAEAPDLNSVIRKLEGLGDKLDTALGGLSNIAGGQNGQPGLFQKLDTLVTENSAKITETMTNIQDVSGKINRGEGTLGRLVNNPELHDELLSTIRDLKASAADARAFTANFQEIAAQIRAGRGTLGTLIYDEAAGENLKATAANLRAVSDKLAKGEGALGQLINDDSLIRSARGTLLKAERALDSMEDSGPISALGTVGRSLF